MSQEGKAVGIQFRKTICGKPAYLANDGGGKLDALTVFAVPLMNRSRVSSKLMPI